MENFFKSDNFLVWVIDWNKVTRWEDLKKLLQSCDLYPNPHNPQFENIRQYCKQIDLDGRTAKGV